MIDEAQKQEAMTQFAAVGGVELAGRGGEVRAFLERHGFRVEEALSAYFESGSLSVGLSAAQQRQADEDMAMAARLAAEYGQADQNAQFARFAQQTRDAEAAVAEQLEEELDVDVDFFEVGLMARRCRRPAPRPHPRPRPEPEIPVRPPPEKESDSDTASEPEPEPVLPPEGLGEAERRTPVPLQGMSVSVRAFCMAAQVEVKQLYVNDRDHPIEAQFRFRHANCSVYALSVCVDGKLSHATMLPKQKAAAKYARALRDGRAAFTLERVRFSVVLRCVHWWWWWWWWWMCSVDGGAYEFSA
jgi:Vault protein inter-alpha-trypsin domain/UBA-like domain